jgi:hypothetical protein
MVSFLDSVFVKFVTLNSELTICIDTFWFSVRCLLCNDPQILHYPAYYIIEEEKDILCVAQERHDHASW